MKLVLFCHSLVSDWNHGNAHFLRGIVRELGSLGHGVDVWEPRDSWSRENLLREAGPRALEPFRRAYPTLSSRGFDPATLDLDAALEGADLVLVHEWSDPLLVARVGEHRLRRGRYRLLFHDTHHRAVTAPQELERLELGGFDGALVFGEVLRRIWLERGWARAAWTWHEAADHRVFRPLAGEPLEGELVWIGNWGDDERGEELLEFLVEPARRLKLAARVHGVRYPGEARALLESAGVEYRGWLANPGVPRAFARHRVTVHVPRRPYAEALPGIPTIRVFEALACGIPLASAPWSDAEGLFDEGDLCFARDGDEMCAALAAILADPEGARARAERARARLFERHTCRVRALELLGIACELGIESALQPEGAWELAS